jgi:transaldolase
MANPLTRLTDLGQSIWLDYIRRDLLENGDLERMIVDDGLAGMTSNPTIFEQAISNSDLYDDDIRAAGECSPEQAFELLAVADIQQACDLFRPLYERTGGRDGFVSIEVNPHLANDTEGTTTDVRRLWETVDRPNVMIKIPGTVEGLPAIRKSLASGINVNVTLLFAVTRYEEVMEAWFQALEDRVHRGADVNRVASVASFFISRVDSNIDHRLATMIEADPDQDRAPLESLSGKIAIANAKIAYEAFRQRFGGGRFAPLAEAGARVQRPLWASTSTKNPDYPDVYYVETLIAPDSVNTLPPKTVDAYRDHGEPEVRIFDDLEEARGRVEALHAQGIDLSEVTRELEEDGVRKFADSYDQLLATIARKQQAVQPA